MADSSSRRGHGGASRMAEPLDSALVTGAFEFECVSPVDSSGLTTARQQRTSLFAPCYRRVGRAARLPRWSSGSRSGPATTMPLAAPYHDARHVAPTPMDTIQACTNLMVMRCRPLGDSAQTSCATQTWGYSVTHARGRVSIPSSARIWTGRARCTTHLNNRTIAPRAISC
jgi:hypothetical protein